MGKQRIEIPITIETDREFSNKKPNVAWNFKFVDDSGVYYEWDTTIDPEGVYSGQKWLVKMTVIREDECLDFPYKIVNRVKFIKKIVKEI